MTTITKIPPKVITANRLGDGRVVFLSPDGWSRLIEEAEVAMGTEGAEIALARANADAAANRVVGPYVVDVRPERGRPVPLRLRERIRLTGPTTGNSVPKAKPGAQAA